MDWGGPDPDDLVGCSSLRRFDLSSNSFAGGVPKYVGNISSLVTLDLARNTLKDDASHATASSGLIQCSKLETLLVGQNNVSGSLPVDFTK